MAMRSPQDVYNNLGVELAALEREELRILLLNTKNVVLRVVTAYSGNVSASLVRVGELFREADRDNVTGVILVHNHPSGRLNEACEVGGNCVAMDAARWR
jgi:DNA repair protein RadC